MILVHPLADLMTQVNAEHAFAATPEARAFQKAILDACAAYWEYLDHHQTGFIFEPDLDVDALPSLLVTYDIYNGGRIVLKGGAIDRRYGDEEDDGLS